MGGEIFVVTGHGQGHLYPSMELCNHLTNRAFRTTLILSSALSSVFPSSCAQNPLTSTAHISPQQAADDLEAYLSNLSDSTPPLCAIVDFQMGWTKSVFWKFNIPVVGFFTFGACAAAMEWGAWKVQAGDIVPGETRLVPGLPEEMALTHSDLKRKALGPGPPKPGERPPWVPAIEGSIALMFNTCNDLDGLFIKYMEDQMGIPSWGVGPLLPEKYWQSYHSSLISDRTIREHKRESSVTEGGVIQWLESKSRGSVLYIAFGSEVGPTEEESQQLVNALERSTRPFIWVVQQKPGQTRPELGNKVGDRGLTISGWAPQLMILRHKSTGGFVSHCGWNSTMEAMSSGVPMLAWPIRGDQYFNAKLVVNYLKLGYRVSEDLSEIGVGIERVMGDEEMHNRAAAMKAKFDDGFPATSIAALDAFNCKLVGVR